MFTCFIRYLIDPNKLKEFKEYAHIWIQLIEKYGGIHHGYFLPGNEADHLPSPSFSFPDIGNNGPDNIAVALFSFPSIEKYEEYRRKVVKDAQCQAMTEKFNQSKCILSYERNFLTPIFSGRCASV